MNAGEEREILEGRLGGVPLRLGQSWSVVPSSWLSQWKAYVHWGEKNNNNNDNDQQPTTKPGKLDVWPLVDASSPGMHRLKKGLKYGIDYDLVPSAAFTIFRAWYGPTPGIERPVVEDNQSLHLKSTCGIVDYLKDIRVAKRLMVDAYPVLVHIEIERERKTTSILLSACCTINFALDSIASKFKLNRSLIRLWKTRAKGLAPVRLLKGDRKLKDYGIGEGAQLILEMDARENCWPMVEYIQRSMAGDNAIRLDASTPLDEFTLTWAIRTCDLKIVDKVIGFGGQLHFISLNSALMTGNPILVDKVLAIALENGDGDNGDRLVSSTDALIDDDTLNCGIVGKQPESVLARLLALGARVTKESNDHAIASKEPEVIRWIEKIVNPTTVLTFPDGSARSSLDAKYGPTSSLRREEVC